MEFITFVTPYKPMICGIADYAYFVTREMPPGSWDVLSFDLGSYGVPLSDDLPSPSTPVWYGIHVRDDFSASSILAGLRPHDGHVLWFQHEFGIWRDDAGFVNMLRDLSKTKIVTLHTLHFQSSETLYGLRRWEHYFLNSMLPHTDAITVFGEGVYRAVTSAFPEYRDKVHVLRHGAHLYPGIAMMSRGEARRVIHEYLLGDCRLDQATRDNLRQQRVFLDTDTLVIGGTGFVTASKGVDLVYHARNVLQKMLPREKIVAVYAGLLREVGSSSDINCAAELRGRYNGAGQFFLEIYLPGEMLAVLLRALDVYFYWPADCTQSGIVAHALGSGATIACRDMEGVGETVKMAGGLTSADFGELIAGISELMIDSRLGNDVAGRAAIYAERFSWRNQALEHLELAKQLSRSKRVQSLVSTVPLVMDTDITKEPPSPTSGQPFSVV